MGAEFLFMDDNARPHRANIVDECLQSEDIIRMDRPAYSAYSPDLNPTEHVWDMLGRRMQPVNLIPPVYRNFGGHCLMSGVIFPKIRLIIGYSACLGVVRPVLHRPGDILRINHHTNHVIQFFVNRFFFEICSRE
ncbi:DDE_3 domain-containing protein [Trichonephila clavipes]|nr:DDE_3 domain-containing protein [Trichonephila clavipes]